MNLAGLVGKQFDQIPFVSEDVAEHHNLAIGFQAWFFQKLNSGLFELCIVAVEIISFENQKNPTTGLVVIALFCAFESAWARRRPVSLLPGGATTTQRLLGESAVSSTSLNPSLPT